MMLWNNMAHKTVKLKIFVKQFTKPLLNRKVCNVTPDIGGGGNNFNITQAVCDNI